MLSKRGKIAFILVSCFATTLGGGCQDGSGASQTGSKLEAELRVEDADVFLDQTHVLHVESRAVPEYAFGKFTNAKAVERIRKSGKRYVDGKEVPIDGMTAFEQVYFFGPEWQVECVPYDWATDEYAPDKLCKLVELKKGTTTISLWARQGMILEHSCVLLPHEVRGMYLLYKGWISAKDQILLLAERNEGQAHEAARFRLEADTVPPWKIDLSRSESTGTERR